MSVGLFFEKEIVRYLTEMKHLFQRVMIRTVHFEDDGSLTIGFETQESAPLCLNREDDRLNTLSVSFFQTISIQFCTVLYSLHFQSYFAITNAWICKCAPF